MLIAQFILLKYSYPAIFTEILSLILLSQNYKQLNLKSDAQNKFQPVLKQSLIRSEIYPLQPGFTLKNFLKYCNFPIKEFNANLVSKTCSN